MERIIKVSYSLEISQRSNIDLCLGKRAEIFLLYIIFESQRNVSKNNLIRNSNCYSQNLIGRDNDIRRILKKCWRIIIFFLDQNIDLEKFPFSYSFLENLALRFISGWIALISISLDFLQLFPNSFDQKSLCFSNPIT